VFFAFTLLKAPRPRLLPSFPEPLLSIAPARPRAVLKASQPRFRLLPLAAAVWLAAALASLVTHARVLDAMSMDDFMRLAEVRDFLGGQSWFDLTQHRLNPPAGVVMHWSRIVDLPIAGLISLFSLFTGRAAAETITSAAWPVLFLFPALLLAGALARRLAGEAAMLPAILLAAVSAPVLVHFRPGALDHHGIQLVLLLATIYGLSDRGDARAWPILGGIASALSLAIGLEMAPVLGALLAAAGLRWVYEGQGAAKLVSNFGLAFGAGTFVLFAATVPFAQWNVSVCDQISLPAVLASALSGGLLALLAAIKINRPGARLVAGIIAGGIAIATIALAFPSCLADPYAHFDARLASVWLDHVAEAQNIFAFARNVPGEVLVNYAAPLAALLLTPLAIFRSNIEERTRWLAPLLALIMLYAISLWEIRGAAGANMIAALLIAAAIVRLFHVRDLKAQPRAVLILLLLSAPVLALTGKVAAKGIAFFNTDSTGLYTYGPLSCSGLGGVSPLAELAPGLVLSHIDLGPAILAGTKHSILAAPYHRNIEGNRIAFDILLGDDKTARRLLHEQHVTYVGICPGAPERFNLRDVAPEGLSERLARGDIPAYLEPLTADPKAPLRVFRVR
jgi:hypothetical protein